MNSYEVLKNAITPVGAKSIAADMNLSTSLIYKWCQSKDYISEPQTTRLTVSLLYMSLQRMIILSAGCAAGPTVTLLKTPIRMNR